MVVSRLANIESNTTSAISNNVNNNNNNNNFNINTPQILAPTRSQQHHLINNPANNTEYKDTNIKTTAIMPVTVTVTNPPLSTSTSTPTRAFNSDFVERQDDLMLGDSKDGLLYAEDGLHGAMDGFPGIKDGLFGGKAALLYSKDGLVDGGQDSVHASLLEDRLDPNAAAASTAKSVKKRKSVNFNTVS